MEFDFDKAISVIRALKAVYDNRDNETSFIVNTILGNKPSLETMLEDLGESVLSDLQNIYDALQQNNLLQEWSGIANALNYAHSLLTTYHTDLGTIQLDAKKNFNGMITVDAGAKQIAYSDWCLGCVDPDGTVRPSMLQQLDELINSAVINNVSPSVSSLSGIFSTATPGGSAGTQGADAIATWSSMVLLAKENGNVSNLSPSFRDETQYESMLRLMNYTFSLVSMTLYLHDTALQLLISSTGSASGNYSLINGISENFGQVSDAQLIWGTFATELQSLASGSIDTQAGNEQAAYTVNTQRSDYAHATCYEPDYVSPTSLVPVNNDQFGYCATQVSLAGNSDYPNAFFGSLGFINVNPSGSPYCGDTVYMAVQGTVVTVGPNMSLTAQPGLYPSLNDYQDPSNWSGSGFNQSFANIGTYEGTYVTAPVHANSNHVSVITGFQLQLINNGAGAFNLALALQFGVLDTTEPENPVVTTPDTNYYPPAFSQQLGIQDYICVNQAGNYDSATGTMRPVLLSNAAICRVANGDNAINVQAASLIYQADFMQPTELRSPLQSKYIAPPATVS